ncbi:MAG: class I SAM-dependent methyltransferase, partial [bacterium]
ASEALPDCIVQAGIQTHSPSVIPAQAGIQESELVSIPKMDSCLRRKDNNKEKDSTKISFAVDDIINLKTTGEFELVIMIAVLHHLPTEELRLKALQSVYKLLKPGGKFVMYNWHLWSWNYRHRYWKNLLNFKAKKQAGLTSIFDALIPWKPLNQTDMRYVHSFTKHELRRLLKQAGFTIEDIYYDTRGKRTNFLWGYNTVVVATKK